MLHKVVGFLTNKQETHRGEEVRLWEEISRLVADDTEEQLPLHPGMV